MQKYLTYRCCRNEEAKRSKHGNILNDNPVNDQPVIYFGPGLSRPGAYLIIRMNQY